MRTIKFRGLRTDGKGWVYGGYFQHTPDEDGVRYYIFDFNEGAVEVIPESVGQFTGLHDKNGKKIYEGDVLEDTLGRKKLVEYYKDGFWLNASLEGAEWCLRHVNSSSKVIGNISENPELL